MVDSLVGWKLGVPANLWKCGRVGGATLGLIDGHFQMQSEDLQLSFSTLAKDWTFSLSEE